MSEEFIHTILIVLLGLILLIILVPILMMLFMGSFFSAPQGMMGGMMNMGIHMFNVFIPFWIFLIIFFLIIIGLIYNSSRETITKSGGIRVNESNIIHKSMDDEEPDIFKVLRDDERKVVELLIRNGGKMLQKDLRWELGMNRVQIHRVIERLEDRNIVYRKPVGNTNEVILVDWIIKKYVKKETEESLEQ